ncbi:hypothetical protein D9M71_612930 [compost metagenome]
MRQFVKQGKEPGSGSVGAINEYDGGEGVTDRESPKLTHFKLAVGVPKGNTAAHHQYAGLFRSVDQGTAVFVVIQPGSFGIHVEGSTNILHHLADVRSAIEATYKCQRLIFLLLQILQIPVLLTYGIPHGVQQFQGRTLRSDSTDSPEIR